MTHICVSKIYHHWFGKWLVTWSAPSHYQNQCWNIVNWTLGNKLQWNFTRNSYIFIQEYPFENGVRKMASILSRPQCVKPLDILFFQNVILFPDIVHCWCNILVWNWSVATVLTKYFYAFPNVYGLNSLSNHYWLSDDSSIYDLI